MTKITVFSVTLIMSLAMISLNALAATGKVSKVKGNSAIVVFDQAVNAGEIVSTGDDIAGQAIGRNAIPGYGAKASRLYSFSYSFSLAALSQNGATTSTLSTGGTFWFNYGQFELGPIIKIGNQAIGSFSTSVTTVGGVAQYDFVKNVLGVILVPGIYGTIQLGSSAAAGATNSTTTIGVGGSLDWFPFVEHIALNFALEYDSISGQGGSSQSQFLIASGPKIYF